MSNCNWIVSDYLQLIEVCLTALNIVVTAFIAIWVVRTVQRRIDNERTLKDHLAHEIIELRHDARDFIAKVINGGMKAKEIKQCHYRLSTHINDLLTLLNKKYGINKRYLKAYRQNLMKIIEDDEPFTLAYKSGGDVMLCDNTVIKLHDIEVKNDHLFNEILLKIFEHNG